jgi:hypothetical protein
MVFSRVLVCALLLVVAVNAAKVTVAVNAEDLVDKTKCGCPNKFFGKVDGRQYATLMAVGPIDALIAKTEAERAVASIAAAMAPPTTDANTVALYQERQDPYRHCVWHCFTTLRLGTHKSLKIGEVHEACGINKPCAHVMDLHNNIQGAAAGENIKKQGGRDEEKRNKCVAYCKAEALKPAEASVLIVKAAQEPCNFNPVGQICDGKAADHWKMKPR